MVSWVEVGTGTAATMCPGPSGTRPSSDACTNDSAQSATSARVSTLSPAGS